MTLFHLLILAIVQGLTEFLPVSSSGHLVLLPYIMGTPDQGLMVDVAVHVGTLGAVVMYFWSDVKTALRGTVEWISGTRDTPAARLAFGLFIATIPVVIAGLALKLTGAADALRSLKTIGWTMLVFGVILYWADRFATQTRTTGNWTPRDAMIMGLWQALALIPGTSRSGACITGGRFLGFDRAESARLAMLMSIPTIIASGAVLAADLTVETDPKFLRDVGLAIAMSFAAALLALTLMMRLLRSVSFTPYVIYRVALGGILLLVAYGIVEL